MTAKAYWLEATAFTVQNHSTPDITWSMEGITSNNGRVSAQGDLHTILQSGAREFEFDWFAELAWAVGPTQYTSIDFYIAGAPNGANTQIDGDIGVIDAALGNADQLRNLKYIGSVVAEEANTTTMRASGSFVHRARYLSFVGFNNGSGQALNSTAGNFKFTVIPGAIQGQDT